MLHLKAVPSEFYAVVWLKWLYLDTWNRYADFRSRNSKFNDTKPEELQNLYKPIFSSGNFMERLIVRGVLFYRQSRAHNHVCSDFKLIYSTCVQRASNRLSLQLEEVIEPLHDSPSPCPFLLTLGGIIYLWCRILNRRGSVSLPTPALPDCLPTRFQSQSRNSSQRIKMTHSEIWVANAWTSEKRFPERAGIFFSNSIQTGSGSHTILPPVETGGFFAGVNQPKCEPEHSLTSNGKVNKNAW
jgi:hypothetical protein